MIFVNILIGGLQNQGFLFNACGRFDFLQTASAFQRFYFPVGLLFRTFKTQLVTAAFSPFGCGKSQAYWLSATNAGKRF